MGQYASLPSETNELYKKYYTEIPLPSSEELESGRKKDSRKEVEQLAASIEEKTGLKSTSFSRIHS